MNIKVRATGVLVENESILLVEQQVSEYLNRKWSLPGGTLEIGETLQECIIREMQEETGLDVAIDKLLYVGDRIEENRHVVHITFAVKRLGGCFQLGAESEPGAYPIKSIKMVPLKLLHEYGFEQRFCKLAEAGFPDSGTYKGVVANIGL